jgi:hypothetical protein
MKVVNISLLLILVLETQCIQAFSPPAMGIGAILFRPKNLIVSPNEGDDKELVEAGKFFTNAFWSGKLGGAEELSEKQIKSLGNSQIAEFRRRYGGKMMKMQDRRAELVVCKNNKSSEI